MFGRSRKGVVGARTPGELDAMEAAGRIVGRALVAARDAAKPGVTTADLDDLVEQLIRDSGAIPSFKGYEGFPGSICVSTFCISSAMTLSSSALTICQYPMR